MTNKNIHIVGIKNLLNLEYQKQIESKTNEIMQNKSKISTESLKTNSVFAKLCGNLDKTTKAKLFNKISSIAGSSIDKKEMKSILYLLDANLEQIEDKNTSKKVEKFVMDTKFDINDQSGIFQATPKEIKKLKDLPKFFDFDNGKYFPSVQQDGSVIVYDKENKPIHHFKKEEVQKGAN